MGLKMKILDKRLLGYHGQNIGWHTYKRLVTERLYAQEDREWWMDGGGGGKWRALENIHVVIIFKFHNSSAFNSV